MSLNIVSIYLIYVIRSKRSPIFIVRTVHKPLWFGWFRGDSTSC